MKLLGLSDIEIGFIYSPLVRERFQDIDVIISCGDLPYFYLEYVVSMLNVPLYFVRGNHASKMEYGASGPRSSPWGAIDLHRRSIEDDTGLILAGMEGCLQYNRGPYQYTQAEYWNKVFMLVPRFLSNKARTGRYLDIFVSHAPPWKVHDADDRPHTGIKAYRWLIKVFQPRFFLHGHIHVYRTGTITETLVEKTIVLNTYGYKEIHIDKLPAPSWHKQIRNVI